MVMNLYALRHIHCKCVLEDVIGSLDSFRKIVYAHLSFKLGKELLRKTLRICYVKTQFKFIDSSVVIWQQFFKRKKNCYF